MHGISHLELHVPQPQLSAAVARLRRRFRLGLHGDHASRQAAQIEGDPTVSGADLENVLPGEAPATAERGDLAAGSRVPSDDDEAARAQRADRPRASDDTRLAPSEPEWSRARRQKSSVRLHDSHAC